MNKKGFPFMGSLRWAMMDSNQRPSRLVSRDALYQLS
jgi:hypothetical protein